LNEVFNIANNEYTYNDAQIVCNTYGAELATYDQIEDAYLNGGEWCNYGWSADQMAFFPTQKSTWSNLQGNPNTQNACGRPGINGGYFANPNIQFGANCYGVKPPPPQNWQQPAPIGSSIPNPWDNLVENPALVALRQNAQINSFNTSEWSRY